MAGRVADKFWFLIMVLQIDSENSATGVILLDFVEQIHQKGELIHEI